MRALNKSKRKQKNTLIIAFILIAVFWTVLGDDYSLAQDSIELLNIQIKNIDSKTVKIEWLTNIETGGKIIYGKSSENFTNYLIDNSGLIKYHEMTIGNLEPEATYYFQIIASTNEERVYSLVQSFKTLEYHDEIAPIISNLEVPYRSGTLAVITWQTNEKGTSAVEFDEHKTYKKIVSSGSKIIDHQIILRNLTPNIRYYFRVYSIDKDNNKSNYFYKEFITLGNKAVDNEDLIISNLRPSSLGDSYTTDKTVIVSFKTNHYAKGYVKLGSYKKDLNYGLNHNLIFTELTPDKSYALYIKMSDIFNKNVEIKNLTIKTAKTPSIKIDSDPEASADQASVINLSNVSCSDGILSLSGYYGQYFNLPDNLSQINELEASGKAKETGWYDNKYLSFSRVDSNLNFAGYNFLPIKGGGLSNDPFYFSAYWRAILEVPETDIYEYKISVDNSGWVYLDNVLVTDMGKRLPFQTDNPKFNLTKGYHSLEIYFVERGPSGSYFDFILDNRIKVHPWLTDCSLLFGQGIGDTADGGTIVKGAEFFYYTPASTLLKTPDSPDIYAIVGNQRHYISSPASFREHGYSWADVKIVSWQELSGHPRARLIKSPNKSTIYYLYQRLENKWFKIAIPSPTAFISYSDNYWGNVIKVTQFDIDSYPNTKLIKTADDPAVYYLENNTKYFISEQVFASRNFRATEIVEVSRIHLDTYKTGLPLK